jgi:putative nucleotidyltransferase with HDIG domain
MLEFFARQRLVRQGLASTKWRRRLRSSEWLDTLRYGFGAKVLVLVVLGAALTHAIYGAQVGTPERYVVEMLVYCLAAALLWMNHQCIWADNSRLFLVFGILVLHVQLMRWISVGAMEANVPSGPDWSALDRRQFWELMLPYAFGPMLLSMLLGQRLGMVLAIFGSLFGAMLNGALNGRSLVIGMLSGFAAALMTRDVRRRAGLLKAGLVVGCTTLLLDLLLGQIGPLQWSDLSHTRWDTIGWQMFATLMSGVGSALVISGVLPVLESIFGITTPITWLELADLNHPLLKRMTLEAPGTYHHSLMVAQLAEAAAESIGANAAMARVCAYFHDIGKLVKPEYFIENMRHGRDAHAELAPTMSALVIIAHVKEGVDLAIKHHLNREIIDVIQQHHGTSTVYYFYRKAQQQVDAIRSAPLEGGAFITEDDLPEVREESFRYHGPKPQTRECAIISLADSIESASRSLEKTTPHRIDQLVEEMIQKRLAQGELKECDLRLSELAEVGESFKRTLRSMLHSRIAYPKATQKRESQLLERSLSIVGEGERRERHG